MDTVYRISSSANWANKLIGRASVSTEDTQTAVEIDDFINRWRNVGGTERANYQLFLTELCTSLGLPQPDPASSETSDNAYVFERRVDIYSPDGSVTRGYIDLYKRGCFTLEAKQTGKGLDTEGWDKAMLAAQRQADTYIRALPSDEGRPPFIVVVDVGRSIELYSEFSRSGGTYVPFPDPINHRIRLEDLRQPEIQERIRSLWTDPDHLDASKHAARVTRELSGKLATLAKSLEKDGLPVEQIAHFLKRCLFTMFSEDIGLIPKGSFTKLLGRLQEHPEHFVEAMRSLWETMNSGGYEGQLMERVRQFNGGLFQNINPVSLTSDQIGLLIEAGKADWQYVEPAIFGTLLERALDPRERHKLGAHYTPRAYVERLVMPTLIEPLRKEWETVQVVAQALIQKDKPQKALEEVEAFHLRLCNTRVLDPACGSGNFLYVAMEHFKRLEGEVLNVIRDLRGGQTSFDTEGLTVDPHQFLGLEINPRAAAITELVLWIGYLQWHHRLYGTINLPEPILKDFHTIEYRDALIEYDSREQMYDEDGNTVTIWDGVTTKTHSATGEQVPDETARIPVYRYINPRRAAWPEADYIVGNPPFIGASNMRRALGDGYVEALRKTYEGSVPDSADFVMYWWYIAAERVRAGDAQRFGFISTNSLRQTFNRRVLEPYLADTTKPLSLVFAIPDHPWVDSAYGAAVRIAMTVVARDEQPGTLRQVIREERGEEARGVSFSQREGRIYSDLTIGANVSAALELRANEMLSQEGVKLHGSGFILTPEQTRLIGYEDNPMLREVVKEYRNGRDLMAKSRGLKVIDLFGLSADEVRNRFPTVYQWVLERVKPERDAKAHTKDGVGYAKRWWLFGKPRPELRKMLFNLSRYIATVKTAKHRVFQFLDVSVIPESKIIAIAMDDPVALGVLTSRIHVLWATVTGSWLGAGNDPTYVKTRSFETFPFPGVSEEHTERIRSLAEHIDSHRKTRQEDHEELTLTDMYNVLEKLRAGQFLTAKEREVNEKGLVSVLRELHDELDRAVFVAYGWDDLINKLVGAPGATTPVIDKPAVQAEAEEELLRRLIDLNTKRAAEESKGQVRWLRPEYQAPEATQAAIELEEPEFTTETTETAEKKMAWPKTMPEQVQAIQQLLAVGPQSEETLAASFKRKPTKSVSQILEALRVLGRAERDNGLWRIN